MEEDEDVVFENSALHQHLKDAGFSASDINAETLRGLLEEDTRCDDNDAWHEEQKKYGFTWQGIKEGVTDAAKGAWKWMTGGDRWTTEVQHLHQKYADELTDEVLRCPAIEEEDNMFLQCFANACLQDRMEESPEGMVSQIFMQMGILGIAVAYGGFRLIYLKSDDSGQQYMWYIDILSVLLTIAALVPATLRFTAAGRVIGKLRTFKKKVVEQLMEVHKYHMLSKRAVRLVQESELVARGFTMVSPMTPVSRLEQSSAQYTMRQCPQLRKTLFHGSRDVMLLHKKATADLLKVYPEDVELEGMSNYLANLPMEEYGPFVLLQGDDKEAELREVTDNYSLSALKAIVHLCNAHVSEFLRVLAIGWLVKADDDKQIPGFGDLMLICSSIQAQLHGDVRALERQYTRHRYVTTEKEEKQRSPMLQQSPASAAYTAVHSLSLHLQAALKKAQKLEYDLEPYCEKDDLEVTSKESGQMLKDLEVAKLDLEACKDCWEEGVSRLERLTGENPEKDCRGKAATPTDTASSPVVGEEQRDPIPLFEMGDPVMEDQVFEAYTDPSETETTDWGLDGCLSDEERARKKREKQEALRVLTELRTVIAVRAVDREDRERKAFQRMYPDREQQAEEQHETHMEQGDSQNDTHMEQGDSQNETCMEQEESQCFGSLIDDVVGIDTDSQSVENDSGSDRGRSGASEDEPLVPQLPNLKRQLAKVPGADLSFAANVAALAAARSQQVAALSEDTFGDDSSDDDDDHHHHHEGGEIEES